MAYYLPPRYHTLCAGSNSKAPLASKADACRFMPTTLSIRRQDVKGYKVPSKPVFFVLFSFVLSLHIHYNHRGSHLVHSLFVSSQRD